MAAPLPILCGWDGESFTPASPHWARQADKYFVVGQTYPLEVREDRSSKSHNHYFAAIAEAWANLPESIAERFASPDHLRKWALIKAGYRDERSISCASKAEAARVAAFMRPMDDYAVVVARGNVVVAWTAKSQSMRAMPRGEFQKSKDAVLSVVAELIGTTADTLGKHARDAA